MNPKFNSDLEWLAFRFAAGELLANEAEAFELRLADDQEAREALARAVELGQLLAHVPAADWQTPVEVAVRRKNNWLRYAGWAIAGATACLALVFLSGKLGREGSGPAPSGSPELAEAWSRSLVEEDTLAASLVATDEELAITETNGAGVSEAEGDSAEPEAISAPAPLAVPSWMLAAVAKDDLTPNFDNENTDVRIE